MRIGIKDCGDLIALHIINTLKKDLVFDISSYYFSMGFLSKNTYKAIKTGLSGYLSYYKNRFINNKKVEQNFIKEMSNIVKKYNIESLLPLSESDIIPLARNSNKINSRLLIPEYDQVMLFHNKIKFIQEFSEKFPLPVSYFPQSLRDLTKIKKDLEFPFILKPTFTPWHIKVIKCQNFQQASKAFDEIKKYGNIPIAQELIDGFPIVTDIICDVTKKPKVFMTYSILEKKWSGEKVLYEDAKKSINIAGKISERLLKKVKWQGTCSIQFFVDRKKPYILEINPRSSAFSISCSLFPQFPLQMVDCFQIRIKKTRKSIILEREKKDMLAKYFCYKISKNMEFYPFSTYIFKLKSLIY